MRFDETKQSFCYYDETRNFATRTFDRPYDHPAFLISNSSVSERIYWFESIRFPINATRLFYRCVKCNNYVMKNNSLLFFSIFTIFFVFPHNPVFLHLTHAFSIYFSFPEKELFIRSPRLKVLRRTFSLRLSLSLLSRLLPASSWSMASSFVARVSSSLAP